MSTNESEMMQALQNFPDDTNSVEEFNEKLETLLQKYNITLERLHEILLELENEDHVCYDPLLGFQGI